MLEQGLRGPLCFGEACYYNNNAPLFGLAVFSKLVFFLEVVYNSHLVNLGRSNCVRYSCKFVFVPPKKKKGSEQFLGKT